MNNHYRILFYWLNQSRISLILQSVFKHMMKIRKYMETE